MTMIFRADDPAIVGIMRDPKYGIPTKLPWGEYRPNSTAA